MCHAACTSFAGLMVARFFLGVGEAAIAPGFTLITGMFYKREEQPVRYVHLNELPAHLLKAQAICMVLR